MEANPYEAPQAAIDAKPRTPAKATPFHWPTFFITAAVVAAAAAAFYIIVAYSAFHPPSAIFNR
jgi:hypothetical protein